MSDSPTPAAAAGGPSAAGSDDVSAAHRLPRHVVPHRYELHLAPDLDTVTFRGTVRIEAEVVQPTADIVLHAAELSIDRASLTAAGAEPGPTPAQVATGADERLTLHLEQAAPAGPCTIDIAFSGVLNDQLQGFYRSTYVDQSGALRTIATTQFEATDARRAFPCFDEPDRKAVFSITLDVPEGMTAFSNGPELSSETLPGGGRRVRFADTIPMSTYLVAFVIGPLQATAPVDVDGTPVRVVHVPGKADLAGYALEVAAHALRFFADWFAIPYPADKLDLVAIPDFAFGAMENLGCVTFRETALLVDPARASRVELERIADVISHEIAHMWFGDLVTMKWWNGIWLNEAFATLMELLCVDHFRPEWQRWVSFGMERDVALATDALHHTRPVEYPVGPPEEAQGMFDVLTYQKGASVLRMLERYLGAERFRQGIRRYLDGHRLSNTDTSDLWDAIEAASGEPVRDIMDTFILQGGFPLVSVEPSTDGTCRVTQEPFMLAPAEGPSAIGSGWRVPLLARSLSGAGEQRVLLHEPSTLTGGDDLVVNAGGSGYYRVRYRPGHLRRLASSLSQLDALERFNLLGDTWAAVVAGRSDLDDLLVLAEALGDERDPDVWGQATGALAFLDHALDEDDIPLLAAYTRALIGPVFAALGWAPTAGEGDRVATLRAQLLTTLANVGRDEAVRSEAARRHDESLRGGAPLLPDLAAAVVEVAALTGTEADYERYLQRYRSPDTPQEEMRYLMALTAFPQPALAERTFALATTEVRSQNAPFVISMLLAHREHGAATWLRVAEGWEQLVARTPVNILPRMLSGVRLLCRDAALAAEVRQFLAAHPIPSGQRTVDQAVERLGVNVRFTERLRSTAHAALAAGVQRLGAEPSTTRR